MTHPASLVQANQSQLYLQILVLCARLFLGGLFVWSGYLKLMGPPEDFAAVIEAYQILPGSWTEPAARVLPWLELITGAYVLLGFATKWSIVMLGGFLLMFIMALGTSLLRGIDLAQCGCFGENGPAFSPTQMIFVDVSLLLLTIFLFLSPLSKSYSLDRWLES